MYNIRKMEDENEWEDNVIVCQCSGMAVSSRPRSMRITMQPDFHFQFQSEGDELAEEASTIIMGKHVASSTCDAEGAAERFR